jgi:hypothetical protein
MFAAVELNKDVSDTKRFSNRAVGFITSGVILKRAIKAR